MFTGNTQVGGLSSGATAYTFTNLTPGATYSVGVQAVGVSGQSINSEIARKTQQLPQQIQPTVNVAQNSSTKTSVGLG